MLAIPSVVHVVHVVVKVSTLLGGHGDSGIGNDFLDGDKLEHNDAIGGRVRACLCRNNVALLFLLDYSS